MTQPQPPYPPQQFPPDFTHYQSASDPLAPARRAGVAMMILGILSILFGACAGALPFVVPIDQLIAQSHIDTSQFGTPYTPAQIMTAACIFMGVICVPLGILFLVCGFFVRRGARWAYITGIIFCALPIAYLMLNVVVEISRGMLNAQTLAAGLCSMLVPGILFGVVLAMLIAALRDLPRLRYAQQQYQVQTWQFQQQQSAYQMPPVPPAGPSDPWQRTYGMTPPPPPPSPPPPPPAGA